MTTTTDKAITFDGPTGVAIYRAVVIARALRTYAATGLKVNTAYTPTAMMKAAKDITGQTFKSRDYNGAADALKAWADQTHAANPGAIR